MKRSNSIVSAVGLAIVGAVGCQRDDMWYQPKVETYESSEFFAGGQASRQPVGGTVARGSLKEDALLYAGTTNGAQSQVFPFKITKEVLERGRNRYEVFCLPCHGKTGDGLGMIVQRGFKQPDSFSSHRLRSASAGYLYQVLAKGYTQANGGKVTSGAGKYSGKTDYVHPAIYKKNAVADSWAMVAYIRALQLSQHSDFGSLPHEDRAKVNNPPREEEPASGKH